MSITAHSLSTLDSSLDLTLFDFLFSAFAMFCGDPTWEEECKRNESFSFFGILHTFSHSAFMNLHTVRGFPEASETASSRNCQSNAMTFTFKFLELQARIVSPIKFRAVVIVKLKPLNPYCIGTA